MRRIIFGLTIAILANFVTPTYAASWKYSDKRDLVADVMPSFVNIYNRRAAKPAEPASSEVKQGESNTATAIEDDVGSGVIVSADGLIVTNRHVIEGAYALFVTTFDGRRLPAKLIMAGTKYDLALIKVDPGAKLLKPATLGDDETMKVGDTVVAIGNPLGFAGSVSSGVISAFHRQVGLSAYDDLIQTDATINRGNSGGPLFNMNGEVIGINQAIYTQNKGGSIGIGFAIPINDFKRSQEKVDAGGRPRVGWLGVTIQPVTEPMAASFGLGADNGGGAIVAAVSPNSPAAAAGLKLGDIIRTFDGVALRDAIALNRTVAHNAGKPVQLGVWRSGKLQDIPVTIGDFPGNLWITKMADTPAISSIGGFGGKFANAPNGDGVLVTDVLEHSIAWYAGGRAGDIIKRVGTAPIRNLDDFNGEFVRLAKAGASGAALYVDGSNGPRWLYIDMLQ